MALVEIARFHDPVGAAIARSALEAGGIDAFLLDAAAASIYGGALMPVRLMVVDTEATAARALLAAADAEG